MIGFIGAGNMGRALIQALLPLPAKKNRNTKVDRDSNRRRGSKKRVAVFDPNPQAKKFLPHPDVLWCRSSEELIRRSTTVFLCIKPKDVEGFFADNRQYFDRQVVISIIAGLTIASLRKTAKLPRLKVCRIMPNLAAAIGKGAGTVTYSGNISAVEKKGLQKTLSASGLYLETPEPLVNSVTAVSGCGPAFVFLFVEALTQAAVKLKVPRKQALRFAIETVIGAGTLLKESGAEPLTLTSQVTSKGGMTIEGVNWLNKNGFQKTVMQAVFKSHAKAKLLFKK